MGVTAEIVAERYKVSREDQDAYALQSQQRYAAAVEKGWIARRDRADEGHAARSRKKGEEPYEEDFIVEKDECNRPETTLEGLRSLKPVFKTARRAARSRPATPRSSPTARRRRC